MKTKLYFVETNAYYMIVSIRDGICRYLHDQEFDEGWEFPREEDFDDHDDFAKACKAYLEKIEDDTSWDQLENEGVYDINDVINTDGVEPDRVIAYIETEDLI